MWINQLSAFGVEFQGIYYSKSHHQRKVLVMLAEHELRKVMNDLSRGKVSMLEIGGQSLTFFWVDQPSSVLTMRTPVYCGENYIPASVRGSLPKGKTKRGYFSIDEDLFEVDMLEEVDVHILATNQEFERIVEDFCYRAEMWRTRLDGRGRSDLIFVRAPR